MRRLDLYEDKRSDASAGEAWIERRDEAVRACRSQRPGHPAPVCERSAEWPSASRSTWSFRRVRASGVEVGLSSLEAAVQRDA